MNNYEHHSNSNSTEKLPGITMLAYMDNTHFKDLSSYQLENQTHAYSAFSAPTSTPITEYQDMTPPSSVHTHNVVSPPLTPAVSPTSMMLDSSDTTTFKRGSFTSELSNFNFNGYNNQNNIYYYKQDPSADSAIFSVSPANSKCNSTDYSCLNSGIQSEFSFTPSPIQEKSPEENKASPSSTYYDESTNGQLTSNPTNGSQSNAVPHKHVCHFNYCGWSFKRYEHLKRHMLVHTGERPHVCHFPGCGKSFSRSDNFHAHYRTHTKKNNSNLQKRASYQKTPSSTEIPSNVAAVAAASAAVAASQPYDPNRPTFFSKTPFVNSTYLYDHQRTPEINNYAQSDYMRVFNSIPDFMQPMSPTSPSASGLLSHENQPNPFFSQERLNYAYTSPMSELNESTTSAPMSNERRSNNASNATKSHVCPVTQCQRRFKRLEHLKRHMRIHTLERPFACTYPNCSKIFSRSDNLSQHMKTHQRHEDRRKKQSKDWR